MDADTQRMHRNRERAVQHLSRYKREECDLSLYMGVPLSHFDEHELRAIIVELMLKCMAREPAPTQ